MKFIKDIIKSKYDEIIYGKPNTLYEIISITALIAMSIFGLIVGFHYSSFNKLKDLEHYTVYILTAVAIIPTLVSILAYRHMTDLYFNETTNKYISKIVHVIYVIIELIFFLVITGITIYMTKDLKNENKVVSGEGEIVKLLWGIIVIWLLIYAIRIVVKIKNAKK